MSRHDRSRSPAGTSEWISKKIVSFGRYPDKRPSGLRVDRDGTMTMESLLSAWGKSQGYTQEIILAAVQKHMFNSQSGPDGAPTLRFTLGHTEDGRDFTIRVHQSRASASGVATPARNTSWAGGSEQRGDETEGGRQDDGSGETRQWQTTGVNWWESSTAKWDRDESEPSWKSDDKWKKKDGESWWEKEKDQDKGEAWRGGGERKTFGRQWGEKVQRWLAYVLKKGHQDLKLSIDDDGSASLSDIVWAIQSSRQNLGITTEDELRDLIEETDQEGRFQIDDDGRIRKLPRGQRSARQPQPGAAAATAAPATGVWQPRRTQRKVSTPPREARGSAGGPGAPKLPPGAGWTRYQDDGVLWWYYEGPAGKWWCQELPGGNQEPDPASLAPFEE